MNVLWHRGVSSQPDNHVLSADALRSEIDELRPVGIGLRLGNKSGHMILVRGYSDGGYFLVNDPWYKGGWIHYNGILTGYGGGSWFYTFMSIQKRHS